MTIAAVTATSWPGRKDYGAERFTDAARIIGERSGRHVRLHLVAGHDDTAPRPPADTAGVRIEPVAGADLASLMDLFAHCDVVLGNDTGLTHLAALVSARAEVIGLYGRHSHSKWRTGLGHHHALATSFSERMHRRDMCPVLDGLDDTGNSGHTSLSAISPDLLADSALLALEQRGT
ncbi:glycosyltransferase family 9 protein [Nocardiopsis sp. ARC36]